MWNLEFRSKSFWINLRGGVRYFWKTLRGSQKILLRFFSLNFVDSLLNLANVTQINCHVYKSSVVIMSNKSLKRRDFFQGVKI